MLVVAEGNRTTVSIVNKGINKVLYMIERDLAHIRFLRSRSEKGEYLHTEDLDFLDEKRIELESVLTNIDSILQSQASREAML